MRGFKIMGGLCAILAGVGTYAAEPLQAVPFTDVKIHDTFWAPRITLDREKVLPHNFKYCRDVGKVDNFLKAAKQMEGKHIGAPWEDSDVYKVIEGAAYCLAHERDPELEATVDDLVAKIAAAQEPDGYLDTFYTLGDHANRWTDDTKHETYCAGHLIEAAVAYYQATGKRNFLDVAIKLADHIDATFGPGKQTDVSEHEEIELALVKLWRVTHEDRYLKLAEFFVEGRGHTEGRKPVPASSKFAWGEYCQDHVPVRVQTEIVGHAVRAMYLYSGVADIAAITGDQGYIDAMNRIWNDVTQRKMYITGGIGPSARNEGFTVAYDLPNQSAYCETCAAIGMAFWNQRMALLHADARYADIVERELYNGALSGVSLDGVKFFYVNPLASRGTHHRQPWHGCACCPTNVVRFLPTIGGYMYAIGGDGVYVNQYVASTATLQVRDAKLTLTQQTRYPWDGAVAISVGGEKPCDMVLNLRVPSWCQGKNSPDDLYRYEGRPESGAATVKVNGEAMANPELRGGYLRIERQWKPGDSVDLSLPMPVLRVKAHPEVKEDVGRVALQRGPVVYCLEGVDNEAGIFSLALPQGNPVAVEDRPELLGGVSVLTGKALARGKQGEAPKEAAFTAVPYYAWDNRDPGAMEVWIPEDIAMAQTPPEPTIATQSRVSASYCFPQDTPEAAHDLAEPANSHDMQIPRLTWWDHRGAREWVQYDFKERTKVSRVEVYWFDDTGIGGCRVPKSWQLLAKDGDAWKPVKARGKYKVEKDKYNTLEFDPVRTTALRIEVELQEGFSGGVLEWRVD